MKARPILFSPPMVQAIIDGRKTQTRRVVKSDNPLFKKPIVRYMLTDFDGLDHPNPKSLWHNFEARDREGYAAENFAVKCPYGAEGDLLWVRESFANDAGYITYMADMTCNPKGLAKWKPSIHMPRWASRLTLEVTAVRVERLQDISGGDAVAEGVRSRLPDNGIAQSEYQDLWTTINGAASWHENPLVWVIEFKVHQVNIDELLKERAA